MEFTDKDLAVTYEPPAGHETPAVSAEKKTAEEWAAKKGFLEEFVPGEPVAGNPNAVVGVVHNPKHRHYDEARFLCWGGIVGKEMTEAEFDDAVKQATEHVYR